MPGRVRELRGSRPTTCRAVEAEAGLRSMDATLQEPAAAPGAYDLARLDAFSLSCYAPAAGKPHLQSALHLNNACGWPAERSVQALQVARLEFNRVTVTQHMLTAWPAVSACSSFTSLPV